MSVADLVAALGGIARVRDLVERGASADAVSRAVQRGHLHRPRRGVVALPTTPAILLRAAAAGGVLAGPSAARLYGFWTPPTSTTFVSVRRDAHVDRIPVAGIRLLRDAHHLTAAESFVVTPLTAVRQCVRLLPFDHAVAVIDSGLNGRGGSPLLTRASVDQLKTVLPLRLVPVLGAVDGAAESGAESIARVRLSRRGLVVRPQFWVTRNMRVDLLIGDHLVVEIGSREFHATPEAYEKDHARAAILVGLGFDYLEFTTEQVMNDWSTVETVILSRVLSQHLETTRAPVRATRRSPTRIAG
jgi:very-short-patch-repair endonuclease